MVTGATSGIGRAVTRAFAAEGARLGLIARGADGLAATGAEIRGAGGEALELQLDLADAAAVREAAEEIVHAWGAIDVWVNNAMVSVFAPVGETTPAEFRRVTEVNYLGTVHGTLAALEQMRPRGAGTIIQIGSALAYRSIPLQSAYCASKAAVRAFTDSLRSELLHQHSPIRLTMLQLPAVNTPQFGVVRNKLGKHAHPVPPLYQPEVIAREVVRAARSPRRERWIGCSAVKAIVGQRLIPGLLDRYLARKAWASQTTDKLPPTNRDNVDAPLPGDRGAHGPFDDEAQPSTASLWASRPLQVLTAAVLVGAFAAVASRRRSR